MKGKEMVALLKRNGWIIGRVKGSHHQMTKDGKSVTVPVHAGKELGKGLEESILKQAGFK